MSLAHSRRHRAKSASTCAHRPPVHRLLADASHPLPRRVLNSDSQGSHLSGRCAGLRLPSWTRAMHICESRVYIPAALESYCESSAHTTKDKTYRQIVPGRRTLSDRPADYLALVLLDSPYRPGYYRPLYLFLQRYLMGPAARTLGSAPAVGGTIDTLSLHGRKESAKGARARGLSSIRVGLGWFAASKLGWLSCCRRTRADECIASGEAGRRFSSFDAGSCAEGLSVSKCFSGANYGEPWCWIHGALIGAPGARSAVRGEFLT